MPVVTVEPIGREVEVAEGQTILDACLRAGVYLPHACGHGLCGTCKVEVLEGEVDHGNASSFALMDFEREDGKTLACSATCLEDVVIEADVEDDPDALRLPVKDFTGTVSRIEDLSHDVKGVWIDVDGDGIAFQAGQYVNLTVPGVEGPRAFSLANPPSENKTIELHIKLVPGGAATTKIHNEMAVGDKLTFSGPYGDFFIRKSAPEPIILIAGGSGLSSPKSMLLDLLESGDERPITLFHGVRAVRDLYFRDMFDKLAIDHSKFTYYPVLSQMEPGDEWSGDTGFVHEAAERHFDGRFEGHKAYLCGPPPMIDAAITSLMKGRLFEKHIFMERFLNAADGSGKSGKSPLFKRI